MKRHLLAVASVSLLCFRAAAYDWPVSAPTVVASFGQGVDGHFESGVAIVGQGTEVRPIAGGEVVFWYDPARRPTSLPRGPGAQVVVQHVERIRSVYSHLAPSTVTRLAVVSNATVIGALGDSGTALGPTLGLQVMDMETRSFLNPLMVLPLLRDVQPPVVVRAVLRRGDEMLELGKIPQATAGTAEMLIEAYDLRQDVPYRWRLAPYAIAVSVNGRQTSSVVFDSLRYSGARLTLGADRTADSVLRGAWLFSLGEIQLQLGEMHLQFFVRDYAGNESTREYFLSIKG